MTVFTSQIPPQCYLLHRYMYVMYLKGVVCINSPDPDIFIPTTLLNFITAYFPLPQPCSIQLFNLSHPCTTQISYTIFNLHCSSIPFKSNSGAVFLLLYFLLIMTSNFQDASPSKTDPLFLVSHSTFRKQQYMSF